jgi:hypothetical protein
MSDSGGVRPLPRRSRKGIFTDFSPRLAVVLAYVVDAAALQQPELATGGQRVDLPTRRREGDDLTRCARGLAAGLAVRYRADHDS